jgi:pSer/pThr/pTyr-binding forkhead associated (FHA) protein
MAILVGMSSALKGQKVDLDREEVFIGRNAHNTVTIDDVAVSGRHCSITRDGHKYTLVDLGSTNGTRLNGAPVTKSLLRPKDIIQIGAVEFMFDGQDVETDSTPSCTTTRVEVMSEPVAVPETFKTASPFGSRRDSRKPWVIVTAILGVLVVVALVFFIIKVL